ncbi:MAG: DUF4357 domain-containing protein [Planctomycetes bacterium]|nr:DUF4357 domain-containing protein [Planctomycetota bacterium]
MIKGTHLVCQHLENISAKVLEDYQGIIREYIRRRHGIYALYKKDRLYYVGLASNLRVRLKQHLKDRHKGLWDRFSVYLVIDDGHIKELESLVLRIVRPTGNRLIGRFQRSENLGKRLTQDIRKHHRKELQLLVGRKAKPSSRKKRKRQPQPSTQGGRSKAVLATYIEGPLKLRANHKGRTVRATVHRDGWISYEGDLYRSPSAAAQAVVGRSCNGWSFWSYEMAPGGWARLQELRR